MGATLYDKVFDAHTVRVLPSGHHQLFVRLHLVHDATSPQAFAMLRDRGLPVLVPERTVATADHIVPSVTRARPYADGEAEAMVSELERNAAAHGIRYLAAGSGRQGIVHVVGPELGLTQPGMTVACGDSHTSAHGALGAVAFGIGTTQVRDVLATQTVAVPRLAVRRIEVTGRLGAGVAAKDLILHLIRRLGVAGGVGFAHEYGGPAVEALSMEERLTLCTMSIEGGAQVGYVEPDDVTLDYLRGRPFAPGDDRWDAAAASWRALRSDADATYADRVEVDGGAVEPMVTWGLTPEHAVGVGEPVPEPRSLPAAARPLAEEALAFMGRRAGAPVAGTRIDVAFVGSCANGRLSDIAAVAEVVTRTGGRVAPHVRALVVPGSEAVAAAMAARGYDAVLRDAGFTVGEPGCSLCVGMNGEPLVGDQVCASTSTRNFKGRQGSPTGRTLLMSPAMVAAAALAGEVVDARTLAGPAPATPAVPAPAAPKPEPAEAAS